ncbi:MAG: type II toxin-antitoxin system PemK/MazF family toxin [Butyrivibrio sp.]|nr:type II toxin-antitoxin system PemK/MazF family toxin [Butyrivibrio sp.]
MSEPKKPEEVLQHIKSSTDKLTKLLETYANSKDIKLIKKADLLSYWIDEYSDYIQNETVFKPAKLKSYKRGDIIKLNFGFNVGAEYGGLHYAIVINNNNHHNSPVVTVIPLTSCKEGKAVHENDVELGNEIYRALKFKYDTITRTLNEEMKQTKEYMSVFKSFDEAAATKITELSNNSPVLQSESNTDEFLAMFNNLIEYIKRKNVAIENEKKQLDKIGKEIANMKEGSIALVSQIVTVSKMKIYDPRSARGVLHSIRISTESMEKIDEKMKNLFIFNKKA